jgi:small GTP-binding protein
VLVYRIALIGDTCVGKTSVMNRFLHNSFNAAQQSTIGTNYETYSEVREGVQVQLQIWDTAGQEKYKSLGPIYYRDASAAVAVFDLTRRETFQNLGSWIDNFLPADGAAVITVGNKLDLADDQQVSVAEAAAWAGAANMDFVATPAKTGQGIREVFDVLLSKLMWRKGQCTQEGLKARTDRTRSAGEPNGCC